MSEYYVLIPKHLNLEQRLSKFPPDFKLSVDYCYYFISDIIKESCNKDTEEYGSFESVINHFIHDAQKLINLFTEILNRI